MIATPQQAAVDYFSDYSAVSQSMLKTFLERRGVYKARYIDRTLPEKPSTDPMRKGTATHTAFLEPERFTALVHRWPVGLLSEGDKILTKAAKAYRDEAAAAGRVLLKDAQYADVQFMAESVKRVCGSWLASGGDTEREVRWNCPDTGLGLKSRLDWFHELPDRNIVFDLKTSADASPDGFRAAVKRGRYWLQAAQYSEAATSINGKPTEFYFVAVESEFPYTCAIHTLDAETLATGCRLRKALLRDLAFCLESGDFSEPWESNITTISLRDYEFLPSTGV